MFQVCVDDQMSLHSNIVNTSLEYSCSSTPSPVAIYSLSNQHAHSLLDVVDCIFGTEAITFESMCRLQA